MHLIEDTIDGFVAIPVREPGRGSNMSQINKALDLMRAEFVPSLAEAFAARFDGAKIETYWSPLAGAYGGYISSLAIVDDADEGEPFNVEQVAFLAGFETAWLKVSGIAATCRPISGPAKKRRP